MTSEQFSERLIRCITTAEPDYSWRRALPLHHQQKSTSFVIITAEEARANPKICSSLASRKPNSRIA